MRFTKEEFCTTLETFQKMCEQEGEIAHALGICEWKGLDWIGTYYDLIVDMCDIDRANEGPYDINDLDYYVWELEFGSKWEPGCYMIEDEEIPLRNAEDCWNLLTREM